MQKKYSYTIKRFNPDPEFGLNKEEIAIRKEQNLINVDSSLPTKTVPKIIKDNAFTLFNLINLILALAIFYVGSFRNLLFMGVVLSNLIIGTYQEIRAKKTVDKLSIISAKKVKAIRRGEKIELDVHELLLDDIVFFSIGDQIPADCILISGQCHVNESLLTGESNSIHKSKGDMLLSGSFVVSGKCVAKVEHVAEQNYACSITNSAKYVKKVNSQIMSAFNQIIKLVSILIFPIGILLFWRQYSASPNLEMAIVNTVAALIGMIPEGLVLLTSTVLAVSVVRLAKYKVLVQELYCIETLARVDTLCLDKTGTLTEGTLQIADIVPYTNYTKQDLIKALSAITLIEDNNPTFNAVKEFISNTSNAEKFNLTAKNCLPFSSEKKWSGICLQDGKNYIMGACEFIFNEISNDIKTLLKKYSNENRVVALAISEEKFDGENLPKKLNLIGFILIKDKIREAAPQTLKYFKDQGVDIKIISGDNVLTVANIAKLAGVQNYEKYIDSTKLQTYEEIQQAALEYTVFGRVAPEQKKQIICALKQTGRTVAMTGDGVNDVLALKEADCSIAMANGSGATKTVSQLVLLDSDFASMPRVVAEGRRSINNIQRSSSLFLVKTIYSVILAILFLFLNMSYPFMPIQMTLTSVLTIGIPSFILALEPNLERIKGNLFFNIIKKAMPGAITIVLSIVAIITLQKFMQIPYTQTSTMCVILTGFSGLMLLCHISKPFNLIRKWLFIIMIFSFAFSILFLKKLFCLSDLTLEMIIILIFLMSLALIIFKLILKFIPKNKN